MGPGKFLHENKLKETYFDPSAPCTKQNTTTTREKKQMNAIIQTTHEQDAKLPATYEAAKAALAQCDDIDECKTWTNKAEALASYAKQSKDTALREYADRIQARAVRRCGELLEQVKPSPGARTDRQPREGTRPRSRKEAAGDAGLSQHQRKTALRVASIPKAEFEAAVDSPNPPTVTKLAERGKRKKKPKKVPTTATPPTARETERQTERAQLLDSLQAAVDRRLKKLIEGRDQVSKLCGYLLQQRDDGPWRRVAWLLKRCERSSPLGVSIRAVSRNAVQVQRQFEKHGRKTAKAPAAA